MRAFGPYPAPADPLVVEAPFQSQCAALESDAIAAIHETQVELPSQGQWAVLVVTKTRAGLVGVAANITVAPGEQIPAVGERPPRISTDTLTSAGGDIESIDTRAARSKLRFPNEPSRRAATRRVKAALG
jgi:hypothetical protein